MTTQMEKIENAKKRLDRAIADLKRLYNDSETSLNEMAKIMDMARLLDITDFTKTITE